VGKPSGIRTEIILNIAFLMAAALVFSGFLLLKLTERELISQRLSNISATMETLSKSLSAATRGEAISSEEIFGRARILLEKVSPVLPLEGWGVAGPDLGLIASSGSVFQFEKTELSRVRNLSQPALQIHNPASWFSPSADTGYSVIVTVPVTLRGQFAGALQARFSLADVRHRMAGARKLIFAYSLVFGIILVLFGFYLLNRTVVRPLKQLTEKTCKVAGGDLEQNLPVEGTREIAALADSFNTMTAALRESRLQTEQHIESLKKANTELQSTRDELVRSEKMASVGHLAAGMAHEIGNPLGALVGYLELLKAATPSEVSTDILRRALAETGRIDRLVRDLLDYAAPGTLEEEILDPVEAVVAARDLLDQQGALEGLQIRNELPPALAEVFMVRHRLVQVFVNLLLNARDASSPGGSIRLAGGEKEAFVLLEVADKGTGIGPEVLGHIFDPFYTDKPPGKGRGLGLSICHRVVSEAGGRIEVQSRPGEGSRFTVWLPKAAQDNVGLEIH
jgi:two-component system NtrC family sensor kinase